MSDHWRYLKVLDDDVSQLSRFIQPAEGNLNTYSLELARLLMIATQECDVLLKGICKGFGDDSVRNEHGYRKVIRQKSPLISGVSVRVDPFDLTFRPFESWSNDETPDWWTANNKVKHQRTEHFEMANLRNVLSAISGVLIANLYFQRDTSNRVEVPLLLEHFRPILQRVGARTVNEFSYIVPRW
ncbi:hypothetical protein [Pseudophaeobacter sp. EL27]|uniref:hypothetical protein n=1 Tax=Pseudophaeobacter sp. EL27 TaxID=2107580 RepID=UPI000EFA4470|nr:hypothetical protein [Pseudophaeobacter sp. EL27]